MVILIYSYFSWIYAACVLQTSLFGSSCSLRKKRRCSEAIRQHKILGFIMSSRPCWSLDEKNKKKHWNGSICHPHRPPPGLPLSDALPGSGALWFGYLRQNKKSTSNIEDVKLNTSAPLCVSKNPLHRINILWSASAVNIKKIQVSWCHVTGSEPIERKYE